MKVLYVYSGKGGVGKSSLTVNLALSIKALGYSVGLYDADFYGPNINTIMEKLRTKSPSMKGHIVQPGLYSSIKVSSVGLFSRKTDAVFWSGKYLEGLLYQTLLGVDWGVEYLLVDMPPGSGLIHQLILSKLPGKSIIITTPQELSFADTIRSIELLEKLQIDILGVIENMSYLKCAHCKTIIKIFGGDTKKSIAKPFHLPIIASIPIDIDFARANNEGVPYCFNNKSTNVGKIFKKISQKLISSFDSPHHLKLVG